MKKRTSNDQEHAQEKIKQLELALESIEEEKDSKVPEKQMIPSMDEELKNQSISHKLSVKKKKKLVRKRKRTKIS